MKYIKNYGTKSEFISAGNNDEFTYYTEVYLNSGDEKQIGYRIVEEPGEDSEYSKFETHAHPGVVKEITPGVAYVRESGDTYYNGAALPNLEFTVPSASASSYSRTYTWEELGITEEIYQKYVSLVKSHSYPSDFNISMDGNTTFQSIRWRRYGEETVTDEVLLSIHYGGGPGSVSIRHNLATDETAVIVNYALLF